MTYGAGLTIASLPGYGTPAAPAAAAGTAAGMLGVASGTFISTAGAGLQIGAGMVIGGQTGNWGPLAGSGIPTLAGMFSELSPLIGPTFEDYVQNYIDSTSPNAQPCSASGN